MVQRKVLSTLLEGRMVLVKKDTPPQSEDKAFELGHEE